MASRESFEELVGSVAKALEFERRVLSAGSKFLPEIARRVRDQQTAESEDLSGYWRWLSGQWVDAVDAKTGR